MTDEYELRVVSYMSIVTGPPLRHFVFSTDPGYWCETDTELMDQDDRANLEDCWRDWWKTGRSWIKPEPDGHCGGCECDPFGEAFMCQDDCPGCAGCGYDFD